MNPTNPAVTPLKLPLGWNRKNAATIPAAREQDQAQKLVGEVKDALERVASDVAESDQTEADFNPQPNEVVVISRRTGWGEYDAALKYSEAKDLLLGGQVINDLGNTKRGYSAEPKPDGRVIFTTSFQSSAMSSKDQVEMRPDGTLRLLPREEVGPSRP